MKYLSFLFLTTFLTCQATPTNDNGSYFRAGWGNRNEIQYVKDESVNLCFAIFITSAHGVSAVLVPCDSIKNKLH